MRLKVAAIVVLLVFSAGAVIVSIGGFGAPATSSTTLLTATASVADVTDDIAATGTVQPISQFALAFGLQPTRADGSASAPNPGTTSVVWTVTEVNVAVGDRVAAGQVLAVADTADLDRQITEATRAAKSAALQLKQATTDRADATTTATRRQTQVSLYNAETSDARAKATLADLEALKPLASITAPSDGVITGVAILATVDAPTGAAITMISADLQVVTSVVESDIAAISDGQVATVTVAALDATLQGRVAALDPVGSSAGSSGVASFGVHVLLDAPPAGLRPGMSADISIVAASATNVVSIPSRALSGAAGAYTVRVVAADGTVTTQQVEVGLVTSSLAEIRSGLQAGDRVVTGTSSSQNAATQGGFGGGGFGGGGIRVGGPGQ